MADANDGRVTLWRAPNGTLHAFPVEGGVEGVWRPRADDDARREFYEAARTMCANRPRVELVMRLERAYDALLAAERAQGEKGGDRG